MKRRFAAAAIAVALALATDAFLIAPYSVELTTHTLTAGVATTLTIVQLSDLHTSGFGRRERAVVALVAESAPDLIVVTGDVVDSGDLAPARPLFERLHAPLGVLVVRGIGTSILPVRFACAPEVAKIVLTP